MSISGRCAAEVYEGYSHHACRSAATLEEDGRSWCKRHAPSTAAALEARRKARWDREAELVAARGRVAQAEREVLAAVRAAARGGPAMSTALVDALFAADLTLARLTTGGGDAR